MILKQLFHIKYLSIQLLEEPQALHKLKVALRSYLKKKKKINSLNSVLLLQKTLKKPTECFPPLTKHLGVGGETRPCNPSALQK